MKIEKCDRCGAESPDKKGLFQGNHWYAIRARMRIDDWNIDKLLLCGKCYKKLKRLVKTFMRRGK